MRRIITFRFPWTDEWELDSQENPVVVGGRRLTECIIGELKQRARCVTAVSQRSFYRWEFRAEFDRAWFYHVLDPVEDASLAVKHEHYWLHRVLLKRPKIRFDHYLSLLTDVLRGIPKVSDIRLVPRTSKHS